MKIVIDIDDKRYKDILRISTVQLKGRTPTLEQVIANGTPLPKGHGRLIDLNDLYDFDRRKVEYAPTIIEGSDNK